MSKYSELFIASTDTITGLGAPVSKKNFNAIYDLKQRPKEKPLIIMVGSLEQAQSFKEWDKKAEILAKKHWPGPVTLILSEKIGLRMPAVPPLCNLIKEIGPVYMTSANISGKSPMSFEEAKKYFKEIDTHYDFGKGSGEPSTIIKVNNEEVLR